MAMKLENLSLLYSNMRAQKLSKTKFEFRFRALLFSVIYIAEQFPHELLFGCRAHNLFIVVQVSKDFTVSTFLGDSYGALIRALNLHPDSNNPFSSNVFFAEFKTAIPCVTMAANTPTVNEIASNRCDVDDADKNYFFGWLNHGGINSSPSTENLLKTRKICGDATYEICRRHLISSRWTADENKALQYDEPTI